MKKTWMRWTDKEIKMLKDLSEAGFTLSQIVDREVFKSRSREGIANCARNNGISLAGPKPETDDVVFQQMMKDARRMKCI